MIKDQPLTDISDNTFFWPAELEALDRQQDHNLCELIKQLQSICFENPRKMHNKPKKCENEEISWLAHRVQKKIGGQ